MNRRFLLCLFIVATLAAIVLVPSAVAQEQPVSPPPSEVTPPQTPSETPSTTDQNGLRQNPSDRSTPPPTAVLPEDYGRDSRATSWSFLVVGLVIGGGIGYFVGRRAGVVNPNRRDRAA